MLGFRKTHGLAPLAYVVTVHRQTKQIGGNEPQLLGVHRDHTDQSAVEACNHPALPTSSAHQDGRADGQSTGNIVQSKHERILSTNQAYRGTCLEIS
jgi:hypothetical protein